MSRRLILWRHGRTSWNLEGRVQGQTDVPLDETGVQQAREAAARLASLRPARIVSSDLQRARATAEELARVSGVAVEVDVRLREMAFGEREGMTWAESWDAFPEGMKAWAEGDESQIPGAESHRQAADRFAAVARDVAATMGEDETVVLVAHGGVLRSGACAFLGFPEATWRSFSGLSNCSWICVEENSFLRDVRWRLVEWNAGTLPEPVLSDDEQAGAGDPELGLREARG